MFYFIWKNYILLSYGCCVYAQTAPVLKYWIVYRYQ
jgi:hypothetical protein